MDGDRECRRGGQPPTIPGYDVVRWLGAGATGEVWLVEARDGGAPLAAKCVGPRRSQVRAGGGAAHRANESEITREWRALSQLGHEHLVAVHDLVPLPGPEPDSPADPFAGGLALIMDYAAGGSVQEIVAARGPLSVGEVVTVLTPLGQVLSFLHGRGVSHGDVSPGNVLLTAQGKPVLADLGLGRIVGQRDDGGGTPGFSCRLDAGPGSASDVYAMAAVGWYALTGSPPPATRERMPLGMFVPGVPGELTAALEAGLNENALERPTAAELARAVFRSAPAEPVGLAQSVHPSVIPELLTRRELRPNRRLRRWRRRPGAVAVAAAVAAAVAVVAAGAVVGVRFAAGQPVEPPTGTPTVSGTPVTGTPGTGTPVPGRAGPAWSTLGAVAAKVPPGIRDSLLSRDPAAALAALAWVRTYALSSRDQVLLEAVNAAGSPAMQADRTIVRALERANHSYTGLETTVAPAAAAVKLLAAGSEEPEATATVAATVTTGPFAEQDAAGAVVREYARAQRQELRFLLVRVNSRWVIQQVLPAA
ncbi:serine/threonine-protein kinase [Specibacter sp. RAF43]|uniref:serine/threonine-protein kinase n=1 Tax=Specibacter sp. RAF43 TaxID=3233057 RepID=UPI003F9471F4